MRVSSASVFTALIAATVTFSSVGVAQAADVNAPADHIAESIAVVAPTVAVAPTAATTDNFATTTRDTTVVVPADGSRDVKLASSDPKAPDLDVALPELDGLDDARRADDGTIVYTTASDAALAVQPLVDGSVRFLSVLESRNAPERYTYHLKGTELELQEDGAVLVFAGDELVGAVDAPWAYDATGAEVPTHYEVSGDMFTQLVDHTGQDIAYPVTADPRLSFGWGVYLNITGAEIKGIATLAIASGGVAAIATCSGVANLPHAAAKMATVLCTAVGAPTIKVIYQTIVDTWKTQSIKTGTCYQMKIVGGRTPLKPVDMKKCIIG